MKKTALITGASSGIGLAYAKYLAKKDWNLDLVSNEEERLDPYKKDLNYSKANYFLYDLSKSESIENLCNDIDVPDLIVANAGIAVNGRIGALSHAEKNNAYYLMCGGVIDMLEKLIPKMMEKGGGRIVIISSIGAVSAMPKSSIYSSIKSAIYAYGKSINAELKNENISVTVSLPGYVKTNAHERAGLSHLKKKVPSWMWVSADQVVKETENASIKGKSEIIPGIVYKITKPFLRFNTAIRIWKRITKKR